MDFLLGWFQADSAVDWVALIGGIVTVGNIITSATPTEADNRIWRPINKVLNFVSMNFGHNKNADAK